MSVGLGLGVALLIESTPQWRAFYSAIYFLPVMATLIAMAIVWLIVLNPDFGLVNLLLAKVGIKGPNWLNDPSTAMISLCVIGIWQAIGFNMVLFMAGLTSVPRDLYDAAELDGAFGSWDRFRTVTWPLIGPVTMFVRGDHNHPVVPDIRYRARPDQGRSKQVYRSPDLFDLCGRFRILSLVLRSNTHSCLPGFHLRPDLAQGQHHGTAGALRMTGAISRRLSPAALLRHAVLLTGAAVILAPFVWMISTSIKPPDEILSAELKFWPDRFFGVENYRSAFRDTPLLLYMMNGLIVTVSIFFFQVLVALPCAYALAKLQFRGRRTMFALVLLCLLIPPHAVAIPVYLLFNKVGILDTYASLVRSLDHFRLRHLPDAPVLPDGSR